MCDHTDNTKIYKLKVDITYGGPIDTVSVSIIIMTQFMHNTHCYIYQYINQAKYS